MSVTALSEAVVKRLMARVDAGACVPPDPCGPCVYGYRACCGSGCCNYYVTNWKYNCAGQCVVRARATCRTWRTGMCSSSCR